MEHLNSSDGDDLTRLFREIAETCGGVPGQQGMDMANPGGSSEETPKPEGTSLSPEDQAEMAADEEYFEQRIAEVRQNENGSTTLRLIKVDAEEDDGAGNLWDIPAGQCIPTEGEIARFYGDSPFGAIRGLSVGGRTHFYTPKAAAEAEHAVKKIELDGEMRDQAADFDLRAENLPWPLRKQYHEYRIAHPEGTRPMGMVIDDYENAARIARHFRTEEAIRAFYALPEEEYIRVSTEIGLISPGDHAHLQCYQALQCITETGWDLEL